MTQHRPLILVSLFSIAFLFGVIATKSQILISTSLLLVLLFVFWIKIRNIALVSLIVLLLGYNTGVVRANYFLDDELLMKSFYGHELVISGKVADDPSYHISGQKEFHITDLHVSSPEQKEVRGKVRIRSYEANFIKKSDYIVVAGKFYKALGNRHGSIQYANIIDHQESESELAQKRLEFFARTGSVLPPDESSLGLGFLVGLRSLLSDELTENLRTTGLTHIVAVSGYNLTILVFLTRRLFASWSKRAAIISASVLLVTFLALTSGEPSIVRATIVSALALTAWYYGRSINPLVLLLVSAAISVFISPYYIWRDIGWWLSFAAFFGVLVIAPQIIRRFYKKQPKIIGQLLIETTCAQLMTLPIIMLIFKNVSVISIVANLLVLPFIPIAMLTTFLAGVANWIFPQLVGLFALPARFILSYIISISQKLADFPGALVELEITTLQMVLIYLLIVFITVILYRKNKQNQTQIDIDRLY